MSQVNLPALTSYLQIFIVLFILNLCIDVSHASANGIKDQTSHDNLDDQFFSLKNSQPEDIELTRRGVWSRLFRSEVNLPGKKDSHSHQTPMESNVVLKNVRIQLLPYDKRTIPIELRKALYAHGIVGRRR